MKAYKIFEYDWTCKGFQYEVGKEYTFDGKIEICKNGFHACTKIEDCFKYYKAVSWNKLAEIEILGEYKTDSEDSKIVTNKIKILREIEWSELNKLQNNDIWGGNDIQGGNNIRGGNYIQGGNYIRGGNDIWGGNDIRGGNDIWGATNCYGIDSAIFIANKKRNPTIFGKKITQERFDKVFLKLNSFNWYPKFNNAFSLYLKVGSKWEKTPADKIAPITKEEAWADMPQEMLEYITSLKEFNAKIFFEITGIKAKKLTYK